MFNEIGGQGIEIEDWSEEVVKVLASYDFAVLLGEFWRHLHSSSSIIRLV